MPSCCGVRRSPRIWAPGATSTGGWRRFCKAWTSRRSGLATSAASKRRARPPASPRCISRSRKPWYGRRWDWPDDPRPSNGGEASGRPTVADIESMQNRGVRTVHTGDADAPGHRRTRALHAREGRQVPCGTVATYAVSGHDFAHSHERATRDGIARRLAALKGFDFAGEYDLTRPYPGPVYLVPSDTLVGLDAAATLGVRGE